MREQRDDLGEQARVPPLHARSVAREMTLRECERVVQFSRAYELDEALAVQEELHVRLALEQAGALRLAEGARAVDILRRSRRDRAEI